MVHKTSFFPHDPRNFENRTHKKIYRKAENNMAVCETHTVVLIFAFHQISSFIESLLAPQSVSGAQLKR